MVTLGSELREVLDGLCWAGTILKVGCGPAGEERARARAASLLGVGGDGGDVGRLRLSLSLSCRLFVCVLTNFEKKPGAIVVISVYKHVGCRRAAGCRVWAEPCSLL